MRNESLRLPRGLPKAFPFGEGGRAKRGRMRSFTGWLRALIEAAAQGRSPEEPLPSASQTPSPGISDAMNGVPTGGDVAFAVRRISDANICCLAGEFPGRCSLSGHHRVLKSIAREISAPEIPPKAVNTKFHLIHAHLRASFPPWLCFASVNDALEEIDLIRP